jgi:hypothetical protein
VAHLETATTVVQMDEPCLVLAEVNRQSPSSRGWRRYQILKVVRDDMPVTCEIDLGPAASFKADQVQIPSGVKDEQTGRWTIQHTVEELRHIADQFRAQPSMSDEIEPRDLIQGYYDQLDQKARQASGISVHGPHGRKWRN